MVGFCGFVLGVGWSPSVHQWNDIIRLWHYEHRKLTTVSASIAVISTASKHLHNDLAKAIEALEQKKRPAISEVSICLRTTSPMTRSAAGQKSISSKMLLQGSKVGIGYGLLEGLRFAWFLLGAQGADEAKRSLRVKGISAQLKTSKKLRRPADVFTLEKVRKLHIFSVRRLHGFRHVPQVCTCRK